MAVYNNRVSTTTPASIIPFDVRETETALSAASLFKRAFKAEPPSYGRHFVAIHSSDRFVAAYIHFTEFEPAVYLCGGLCVDSHVYRALSQAQRTALATKGSLSRWFSDESIAVLGDKRAVFAYTGDIRSRRDAFALGFVPTSSRFLLVQWHGEPESKRHALVRRVEANGPF
jgi:hypothetical protein